MTRVRLDVVFLMSCCVASGCGTSPDFSGDTPQGSSDTLLPVASTNLYVRSVGSGTPTIVLHGGPVLDHGYLVEPLRPLQDRLKLVYFDQRLSGRSDGNVDSASVRIDTLVQDIEGIRAGLGLGRVHVIGHSWGGLLALKYALRHAERVRSLILLDPMPPSAALWQREQQLQAEAVQPGDTAGMAALRASDAFRKGKSSTIERMLQLSFRGEFHDPSKAEGLRFHIPTDYSERSEQFAYMYDDLVSYDVSEDLSTVSVPVLVVYGSEEPGSRVGRHAYERLPCASIEVIAEAGHFPFIERPLRFHRTISRFLDNPTLGCP